MNKGHVVLDLFAGCGGLSLGFEMAGFNIPLAVEIDEWASETYRNNHPVTKVMTEDITKISELDKLLPSKFSRVDGIIGGPPCQGFSLSGNRDKRDPRNSLFMEFVRFVKHFEPKFFVMENVPGLLSMRTQKGEMVKDVIKSEFEIAGYNVDYHILDATMFGEVKSSSRAIRSATPNSKAYVLMGYKEIADDHIIAARQDSTLNEMFVLRKNVDSPIDAVVLFEYWDEITTALDEIFDPVVIKTPGRLLNPS